VPNTIGRPGERPRSASGVRRGSGVLVLGERHVSGSRLGIGLGWDRGGRAPSELPPPSDPAHGSGAALAWNQPRSASGVRRGSGVLVLGERHHLVDLDVHSVSDVEDG
jgi:hypothetical protein